MLSLILLVFAFVLLLVAGLINAAAPWRDKLACLGLACWVLSEIIVRSPLGGVVK